jgi:hypothetical protein
VNKKEAKKTLIRSGQDGFTAIDQKSKGLFLLFSKKKRLLTSAKTRRGRCGRASLVCRPPSASRNPSLRRRKTSLPENRIPTAF